MDLFNVVEDLYIKGKYEEALNYFLEAYENQDNDTLNYIGCCNMMIGNYVEALDIFNKILQSTLWERALFNKGRVYLKLENYNEALANFNRALMVNPNNDEVYFYLGVYYDKIKDYVSSKAYYEKAIMINSNEPEYHLNLGLSCNRVNEFEKALVEFEICISFNDISTKSDAIFNKGLVFINLKKYEEAIKQFNEVLNFNENDLETMNMIANCYYYNREYKKSLFWLNKVLEIDKYDPKAEHNKKIIMKNINKLNNC